MTPYWLSGTAPRKTRLSVPRLIALAAARTTTSPGPASGSGAVRISPLPGAAIQKARDASMPKDNIERAIAKGTGADSDADAYESVVYEGYGPGGVAVLVEALTDNRNRTGSEIRHTFTKHGGNLASTGAVAHMFEHVGEIRFKAAVGTPDAVLEAAIEAGADDVVSDTAGHIVTCSFDQLGTVAGALEQKLGEPESVKAVWKPNLSTEVDEENAESIMKLIAALEDDDDVQNVFANFEVSEDVLKKLTAA